MKRQIFAIATMVFILVCAAPLAVFAADTVQAVLSRQQVYLDGQALSLTAYNIDGNNYVRLRDIGAALDIGIEYDAATQSVIIDTLATYNEPSTTSPPVAQTPTPSSGAVAGATADNPKVLVGDNWSLSNYSQQANPQIFNSLYTEAAYNAAYDTIHNQAVIIPGNDTNCYNPTYRYAHTTATPETKQAIEQVLGVIRSCYWYETSKEPHTTDYYQYPGYFIVLATEPDTYASANQVADVFLQSIAHLSDRERAEAVSDYLREKVTYSVSDVASVHDIITTTEPTRARCSSITIAANYLYGRAGFPTIIINGDNHSWNIIYIDGQWVHVDVTANDAGDDEIARDAVLLAPSHPVQIDSNPTLTRFAQELLVPGSTK